MYFFFGIYFIHTYTITLVNYCILSCRISNNSNINRLLQYKRNVSFINVNVLSIKKCTYVHNNIRLKLLNETLMPYKIIAIDVRCASGHTLQTLMQTPVAYLYRKKSIRSDMKSTRQKYQICFIHLMPRNLGWNIIFFCLDYTEKNETIHSN